MGGLWGVVSGPLVWAAHFTACYALLSVGCAAGWQRSMWFGIDLIRLPLLLLTALAVLVLLALLTRAGRAQRHAGPGSQRRFLTATAAGAALLSLIGVIWLGLAIPLMAPCHG